MLSGPGDLLFLNAQTIFIISVLVTDSKTMLEGIRLLSLCISEIHFG